MKARIDASDLVQQTCLSVFKQIGEFFGRDPAQYATWLRQVHERNIRNAVRDHGQKQKRALNREEHLGDREAVAVQTTPSQHAIRQEEGDRLTEALAQLPPAEREVLRLRYLEDRTLEQVSEQLGLTKDAVVWLMQKGMKRVRQLLK